MRVVHLGMATRLFIFAVGLMIAGEWHQLSIAEAAAPVLYIESTSAGPGESISTSVILGSAPNGVAGFVIVVSVDDDDIAVLSGASFPHFDISMIDEQSIDEMRLWGVDLSDNVQNGAENVVLAELELLAVSPGSTGIEIEIVRLDDDRGDNLIVTVPKVEFEVIGQEPPKASFEYRCEFLTCDFEDTSEDEDDIIVSWHWAFGDGSSSDQPNPSHTYPLGGTYSVSLLATDGMGNSDLYQESITVIGETTTIHVHNLDQQSTRLSRGRWTSQVTTAIFSSSGQPVAGAAVTGEFHQRRSLVGVFQCTTNALGACAVNSGTMPRKRGQASFTVISVAHPVFEYRPVNNHDNDGDSDGTTISLIK